MSKTIITIGYIVMLLAQWFVPANMILEQERVLTEGTPYKFKTRPIDPNDPFRGKFIVLQYEMNKVAYSGDNLDYDDTAYVYIKQNAEGFAEATHASTEPLGSEQDYIKVNTMNVYNDTLYFDLPFNTFYMNENKAYDAEVAVREATRDSLPNNCYGLVYIKGDRAVLKDVKIDAMSIKDFVEKELE